MHISYDIWKYINVTIQAYKYLLIRIYRQTDSGLYWNLSTSSLCWFGILIVSSQIMYHIIFCILTYSLVCFRTTYVSSQIYLSHVTPINHLLYFYNRYSYTYLMRKVPYFHFQNNFSKCFQITLKEFYQIPNNFQLGVLMRF